ncbi:hypothetical protein BDK51DRAFT_43459, partial [Blyttiomyces helicus]
TSSSDPASSLVGLQLAEIAGLPESTLRRAEKISKSLKAKLEASRARSRGARDADLRDAKLKISQRLLQARCSSTLADPDLRKYLAALQRDYKNDVDAIHARFDAADRTRPDEADETEDEDADGGEARGVNDMDVD